MGDPPRTMFLQLNLYKPHCDNLGMMDWHHTMILTSFHDSWKIQLWELSIHHKLANVGQKERFPGGLWGGQCWLIEMKFINSFKGLHPSEDIDGYFLQKIFQCISKPGLLWSPTGVLPDTTWHYRALQLSLKLADVMVTFSWGYGWPFPPEHVNDHLLWST